MRGKVAYWSVVLTVVLFSASAHSQFFDLINNNKGKHVTEQTVDHEALWSGFRLQNYSLDEQGVRKVLLEVSDRTKFHELILLLADGSTIDLMEDTELEYNPFIDESLELELYDRARVTGLMIEAESYSSHSSGSTHVAITVRGKRRNPPTPTFCVTRRGVKRDSGEIWDLPFLATKTEESVYCPYGGNKVEVYELIPRKHCVNGKILDLPSYKGQLIDTHGACLPKPRPLKCGLHAHGSTWELPGRTVSETRSCGRKGRRTQAVTFQFFRKRSCDNGTELRLGREKREISAGRCERPKQPTRVCKEGKIRKRQQIACGAGQGGHRILAEVCKNNKWKRQIVGNTCDGNDNVGGGDGF